MLGDPGAAPEESKHKDSFRCPGGRHYQLGGRNNVPPFQLCFLKRLENLTKKYFSSLNLLSWGNSHLLFLRYTIFRAPGWLVKRPALDLGSGHELTVSDQQRTARLGLSLSLPLSAPPVHALPLLLSLKINKHKKKKKRHPILSFLPGPCCPSARLWFPALASH